MNLVSFFLCGKQHENGLSKNAQKKEQTFPSHVTTLPVLATARAEKHKLSTIKIINAHISAEASSAQIAQLDKKHSFEAWLRSVNEESSGWEEELSSICAS